MSDLPDDLWRKILDFGINNSTLTYEDLCSISITCKRLHRLSGEHSLWSYLLSSDFPEPIAFSPSLRDPFWLDPIFSIVLQETANESSSSSSTKSQYRIRLERDREREPRLEARRRAFLERGRRFAELRRRAFLERGRRFAELRREQRKLLNFPARWVQRRAVLEHENLFDILSAKIQEIELAEEKRTRKPTVADLFNSTKANSRGFERVPDRRYPRERSKGFTQQTKSWHR